MTTKLASRTEKQRRQTEEREADLRLRAARLLELPLEYIASPEFDEKGIEKRILGAVPAAPNARRVRAPEGLPAYLGSLYEVPLLTKEQEQHLFRQYNFLKRRASKLRERLDMARPNAALVEKIEAVYRQAVEAKNQIIQANLRLVVSIARKYAHGPSDLFELISSGNMSLLRAVEKFNYSLGFKFSTYATWAIRRNFAHDYVVGNRYHERFRSGQELQLEWAADLRTDSEEQERQQGQAAMQVGQILDCLSDRERDIVTRRFGLDGASEGKTLQEVGIDLGVSKERIRQLEARALDKLRKAAAARRISHN